MVSVYLLQLVVMDAGKHGWLHGFYELIPWFAGIETDHREADMIFRHKAGAYFLIIIDVIGPQQAGQHERNMVVPLPFAQYHCPLWQFHYFQFALQAQLQLIARRVDGTDMLHKFAEHGIKLSIKYLCLRFAAPAGVALKPLLLKKLAAIFATSLATTLSIYASGKDIPIPDSVLHIASFVVSDTAGQKLELGALNGKVVFINFWSLSCAPCKAEMPTIYAMQEHYKNDTDFRIVLIDLDQHLQADLDWFRLKGLELPVYKIAGAIPDGLFQGVLPTTAVIDKNGNVAFYKQEEGNYDAPEFTGLIDSLLRR